MVLFHVIVQTIIQCCYSPLYQPVHLLRLILGPATSYNRRWIAIAFQICKDYNVLQCSQESHRQAVGDLFPSHQWNRGTGDSDSNDRQRKSHTPYKSHRCGRNPADPFLDHLFSLLFVPTNKQSPIKTDVSCKNTVIFIRFHLIQGNGQWSSTWLGDGHGLGHSRPRSRDGLLGVSIRPAPAPRTGLVEARSLVG